MVRKSRFALAALGTVSGGLGGPARAQKTKVGGAAQKPNPNQVHNPVT